MAITVYSDVIVPKRVISAGLKGRLIRQNRRVQQVSGFAQINAGWEQGLREYEFGVIPMSLGAWQDIETLHEITFGGAYGMLLEDPKDSQVASGVVTALTSTTFQLEKLYTHAGSARTSRRKITRPRAAGFVLSISGVPTGSYTLDVLTGIVTIPSAPTASAVTWTGLFYVPVNFMNDSIDWTMVRPGSDPNTRLFAGPSVILQEIRE